MYRVLAKAVHHEPPIDVCVAKHCHVQILMHKRTWFTYIHMYVVINILFV